MRARLALLTILSASGCAATGDPLQHYQSALGGRPTRRPSAATRTANRRTSKACSERLPQHPEHRHRSQSRLVCELRRNRDAADRRRGSTSARGEHRIHIGLEGGFTLGWQGNIEAFAFGSNGAVVVATPICG